MKLFSTEQIRRWDAFTIEQEPIASIDLMERAATACFNWLLQMDFGHRHFNVFCGKGNNGGDGLALARLLAAHDYSATVYLLENGSKGSPDFETNLDRLKEYNVAICHLSSPKDFPLLANTAIIIDALFGTGLNKIPDGMAAAIIQFISSASSNIIAIDIPSGMYADKSSLQNAVVKANYTLSFQQNKLAFMMPENENYFGKIQVLDIGLYKKFTETEPAVFELTDAEMIGQIYRPRKQFSHKGTYGHALLYAGSKGMMGAAVLATKACLRSGAGLLTVAVPEIGYNILQVAAPEAMCITDTDEKFMEYCWHKKSVIAIGPGWGTGAAAFAVIENILEKWKGQLLLDAAALTYLAQYPQQQKYLHANSILTPHPKEFDDCFGKSNTDFDRVQLALRKAAALKIYIVLKGHHTLIATPEGNGYFNSTGNAGMAKGGSGDVLTGIITALLSQGYNSLSACIMGVYLHGLAADLAAAKLSQEAMTATDIIDHLSGAFLQIAKSK